MSEPEILTEVPASLKLLVRIIMRCFYGDEHAVVMDKLIHHPCIKEDDLLQLLRFERKQLRAVITSLRNEKVLFCSRRLCYPACGHAGWAIKIVALYFCPRLCHLLNDFQNFFTGLLCRQFAIM